MRAGSILIISVLISLPAASARAQEKVDSVKNITVEDAYRIIDEAKSEILILDVRTPGEYHGPLGHVEGAILRPVQEIQAWSAEIDSLKSTPVVIICKSGGRSMRAALILRGLGFQDVSNVVGGMVDWNRKELPVARNRGGE